MTENGTVIVQPALFGLGRVIDQIGGLWLLCEATDRTPWICQACGNFCRGQTLHRLAPGRSQYRCHKCWGWKVDDQPTQKPSKTRGKAAPLKRALEGRTTVRARPQTAQEAAMALYAPP